MPLIYEYIRICWMLLEQSCMDVAIPLAGQIVTSQEPFSCRSGVLLHAAWCLMYLIWLCWLRIEFNSDYTDTYVGMHTNIYIYTYLNTCTCSYPSHCHSNTVMECPNDNSLCLGNVDEQRSWKCDACHAYVCVCLVGHHCHKPFLYLHHVFRCLLQSNSRKRENWFFFSLSRTKWILLSHTHTHTRTEIQSHQPTYVFMKRDKRTILSRKIRYDSCSSKWKKEWQKGGNQSSCSRFVEVLNTLKRLHELL